MFKLVVVLATLSTCTGKELDLDNIHLAEMRSIFLRLSSRAELMEKLLESYQEELQYVKRTMYSTLTNDDVTIEDLTPIPHLKMSQYWITVVIACGMYGCFVFLFLCLVLCDRCFCADREDQEQATDGALAAPEGGITTSDVVVAMEELELVE